MDKKTRRILESVKDYIEKMEVKVDWEWGGGRELEEIQKDGDMPALYRDVTDLLQNEQSQLPRPGTRSAGSQDSQTNLNPDDTAGRG